MLNLKLRSIFSATMATALLAAAVVSSSPVSAQGGVTGPDDAEAKSINASGATFPLPLYQAWNSAYAGLTGVQVNYTGGGSGKGKADIRAGAVNFGGSDSILTDQENNTAAVCRGNILSIAATMGGIVPLYNVPELGAEVLKLSANDLAKIYTGDIRGWNDPILVANNPGLANVAQPITPVFRSESSGTTENWALFLSKEDSRIRVGSTVNWLVGVGAQGNPGVANQVKSTPYSIGYVELAFATDFTYAAVKNPRGAYIKADAANVAQAAVGVSIPSDTRVRLVYASSNPRAYPITTFTWIMVCADQPDAAVGRALARYLWWTQTDGQQYATNLGYAPLPANVVRLNQATIKRITSNGERSLPVEVAR